MKISIRKVDTRKPEIVALLKYLQKECLPTTVLYDVNKGHWWIAYDGNIPIGFAGLVRSASWYDCGYLCRGGIIAGYRGHKLQRRLIKVREMQAKKLGWTWIITDTRDNPASANNLISAGFKMYTPTKPWGFKDALYWRKKLNAVQRSSSKKRKTGAILEEVL